MKYFTKYLPVEGEITDVGVAYKSKKFPHLEAKYSSAPWKKSVMDFYEIEKVKLFLCSRDIQVGDKIKFHQTKDEYKNGNYNIDGEVEGVEKNIVHVRINDFTIPVPYNYCIKIIGEVSPDALSYVREGQEFTEDQVKFSHLPYEIPKSERKGKEIYQIKGPCGHMH